jgi:hypothetical protein
MSAKVTTIPRAPRSGERASEGRVSSQATPLIITAQQAPHWPGFAPALGLRTEG